MRVFEKFQHIRIRVFEDFSVGFSRTVVTALLLNAPLLRNANRVDNYRWNQCLMFEKNKSLCTYDVVSFPEFSTLPYCPGPPHRRPLVRAQQRQGVPLKGIGPAPNRTEHHFVFFVCCIETKKYYTTLFAVQHIYLFISVKVCTRFFDNFVVW